MGRCRKALEVRGKGQGTALSEVGRNAGGGGGALETFVEMATPIALLAWKVLPSSNSQQFPEPSLALCKSPSSSPGAAVLSPDTPYSSESPLSSLCAVSCSGAPALCPPTLGGGYLNVGSHSTSLSLCREREALSLIIPRAFSRWCLPQVPGPPLSSLGRGFCD